MKSHIPSKLLILCRARLIAYTSRLIRTCGRGQHLKKDAAKRLSAKQCDAALEIFNNHKHSEENLEVIHPVLLDVLQTVILGMSEVEHYFSKLGQKLDFPELLKDKRYIYLRACTTDGE